MTQHPHRDEWMFVALVASACCIVLAAIILFFPVKTTVEKNVYVKHPKGLVHLPAFDSTNHITPTLDLVCDAWGTKGLNPNTSVPTKGQRLVSDCEMVKVVNLVG